MRRLGVACCYSINQEVMMMGGRRGGIRGADGSLLIIIYVLGLLLLFLKDHAIILSSLLCLIH